MAKGFDDARAFWDERFGAPEYIFGTEPNRFLASQRALFRPGMRVLDVACGEGRNAVFLAQNGFRVTGVDISDIGIAKAERLALAQGLAVEFRCIDLEGYQITEQYDVIVNCNFLLRDLIPTEVKALTPRGLLLFDTLLASPQLLSAHNPDYLLRQGELGKIFRQFAGDILCSEESTAGETPTARLLFRKQLTPEFRNY